MARTDTFTRNKSRFEGMDSSARRDFHSPEAQRFRNQQRKEKRERGEVYDVALTYQPPNNEEGIATATNDTFGNDEFTLSDDTASGGGSGLPEFPGAAPSANIKAPLIWDDDAEKALWLQGETQDPSDDKTYVDIFGYDPAPSVDVFSLVRTELLDGIICENGEPVNGKVLFIRDAV